MDGHNSHITHAASKFCHDHNIILLCLQPQTTHALQPLDVGIFKAMKNTWRDILKTWFRETRLTIVDKSVFPKLLKKLYEKLNESWACSGFEASGLFTVNRLRARKKILDYTAKSSDGDVALTAIQQAVLDVIMPQMSTETESIVKQRKKQEREYK